MFFECRKKRDLYLWLGKARIGPSAKFHIENIHTSDELKMTGNCLKGSRPLLSFDKSFEELPQFQLLKELFIHIFGIPNYHPKSKPFYDHVFNFSVADDRIWFRNYQINYKREDKDLQDIDLVEIGPRFTLNPIKIFEGCMEGMVLFSNPSFKSPNLTRRENKNKGLEEKLDKKAEKKKRKEALRQQAFDDDILDNLYHDAETGTFTNSKGEQVDPNELGLGKRNGGKLKKSDYQDDDDEDDE